MNKAFIFLLLVSLSSLVMCKKGIEKDKLYIRGRLFLLDTVTQTSNNIPLAKKRVTISYDNGDSLNYLYSDTTDRDGYFYFDLMAAEKDNAFVVRYDDSLAGHYYYASTPARRKDENVVLIARLNESKENGFILHIVDSRVEGIPNATIRLYNNQVLALQNDPAGAVESFSADRYGNVYRLTLPPGTYYVNGSKTVDTANFLRVTKTIQIPRRKLAVSTVLEPLT